MFIYGNRDPVLQTYTDADMVGYIDTQKSMLGYLMIFSGGAVSWQSKLQKYVALSLMEVEYIAITKIDK